MTTQDVQTKFDQMVIDHNGKLWEVEDPSNPDQCFDLAFGFVDYLGIPRETIRHQYAVQIYKNPLDVTLQYFEFIPNTPNGVPHKGDVVVFDGPIGHVSVATGNGNVSNFDSFDQNFPTGSKCHVQNHGYQTVLGWLRPRVIQPQPALIITDQTRIPQIDNMEVQAIRSQRNDMTNQINSLMPRANKFDNIKTIADS